MCDTRRQTPSKLAIVGRIYYVVFVVCLAVCCLIIGWLAYFVGFYLCLFGWFSPLVMFLCSSVCVYRLLLVVFDFLIATCCWLLLLLFKFTLLFVSLAACCLLTPAYSAA
jgi:hypothetical protein